jgi:hypothetical protein
MDCLKSERNLISSYRANGSLRVAPRQKAALDAPADVIRHERLFEFPHPRSSTDANATAAERA